MLLAALPSPTGLCVAPWGAVYVACAGSNNIKSIHNGYVSVVAGDASGALVALSLSLSGHCSVSVAQR